MVERQHQVSMGTGVAVQAAGKPLGMRKGQLNQACSPAAADPLLMSDQKRSVEGRNINSNAPILSSELPHLLPLNRKDINLKESHPEIAPYATVDVGR